MEPDFYMVCTEGRTCDPPRKCWTIDKLSGLNPDGYLLARIDPPLEHADSGQNYVDDHVLLVTKIRDRTLFQIENWPAPVFVVHVTAQVLLTRVIGTDKLVITDWANLWAQYDDAYRDHIGLCVADD